MKKLLSILIILALNIPLALANPFLNIPDSIPQGTTLKIEFPKHEKELISASIEGKNINLYEIEKKPEWDEKITRAEFLKLLFDNYNFGAIVGPDTKDFPDVSKESEYYEYIQKAQKLELVSGYADGNFGPFDPITRSHIAKILVEAFDPPEYLEEAPTFPDVKEEHWHYEYINRAVQASYFKGYPDGFMQPDRYINFDEAGIVIKRAAVPQGFKDIENKTYYVGYVGFHRMNDVGIKNLQIITDTNDDYQINVIKREYPSESFYLEEKKNELFAEEKIDNTWELINGAKANPYSEQLWEGEFIVPTDGILTLGFGDILYINGNYAGSHFGLDYANVEGTPIYASNNGIVTLASDTMSYGNTIVIDHGHNVFTMYLHNHELKVEEGQRVNKGDLIATMGSTGIATGPHLHFTFFIGDVIVDNYEWYEGKF